MVQRQQSCYYQRKKNFSARFGSLPYCKKLKTTFEKNHIKVLDWPGNSPSLKPIGSIVKIRLLKRDGTSETKLIDATIDVWYCNLEITQNCGKLVESMPKRTMELITDNRWPYLQSKIVVVALKWR